MWWLTADGGYANADTCVELRVGQPNVSSPYMVRAITGGDSSSPYLAGEYTTEAEATEAARKLCQGIDPTTITS